MAIGCFEVEWTKLFPYDEAETRPEAEKSGIYAKVIGKAKMIHYIGKSETLSRRSGEHRRADRRSGILTKKHYISFGIIYSFGGREKTRGCMPEQLNDIESYLVNTVKPKGNAPLTMRGYKRKPLIIVNTGKVLKPIQKIMTSNPELAKLIVTKKRKTSSPWL
jgi:hypothetical protein